MWTVEDLRGLVTRDTAGRLKLDFSNSGLMRVPEAVSMMTEVEVLALSGIPIPDIPESFLKLKNLQELVLKGCKLKNVSVLMQLTTLKTLDISSNDTVKNLPDGLSNLKQLQKLNMERCGFTEIPTDFTQLTSLEELDLSNNSVKSLPTGFSNLTKLRKLNMWECGLTEIPTDLTQLTSLEELYLSFNSVKSLPVGFSNLKKLRKLIIRGCELTEIPIVITQLTSLKELDLSWNPVKSLPVGFSDLKQLQKLEFKNCGMTEIPTDITQLTSLKELDLSWNPIKSLPVGFSDLKKLQKLDFKKCGMTEIPTDITQLTSLEELDLSSNPVKSIPTVSSNLKELRKLRLTKCTLSDLPEEICDLVQLDELQLGNNQLREIPCNLTKLKHLRTLEMLPNPMQIPPSEVCQQGVQAVFSYLVDVRYGRSVHQKIVLLGSSGAGKTSLAKTLVKNESSCVGAEERTIVVDIITWELEENDKNICISVIDFGGNDWYKVVHHLFVEQNAIFVLVVNLADFSENNFHRDIGSWLSTLLTRVPTAALRIVGTHADMLGQDQASVKCKSIESSVDVQCKREGLQSKDLPNIDVVSSETMMGIPEFRKKLVSLVCEKGKVVPPAWLELYKSLRSPSMRKKPYLVLEDIQAADKEARRGMSLVTWVTDSIFGRQKHIRYILEFLHAIGAILWYHETSELAQYVFHNPEFLVDLFKAVFSERQETESLSYGKGTSFQTTIFPGEFEQIKMDLLREGIMPRELLKCLWKHKELDGRVFDAMIHLFVHLDLCYPLRTDEDGQVASLRFPWFLKDGVPDTALVQQILFGPPAVTCLRFSLEYEFLSICPPPLYEKFAVRLHRHVHDKKSRIDWKDGVYANINLSRLVVHRVIRGKETVISLTVEGEDICDLWTVLTALDKEMKSVMSEWPGVKWENWLLCPHCLQYGISRPGRFPGRQISEPFPRTCPEMTCERDATMKVPSCLVYPVKGEEIIVCRNKNAKHQKTGICRMALKSLALFRTKYMISDLYFKLC